MLCNIYHIHVYHIDYSLTYTTLYYTYVHIEPGRNPKNTLYILIH